MLHKIPVAIPTNEGIMFIPKVATSLEVPYTTWAYCREIKPAPEDAEGKEFGWWEFSQKESMSQEVQDMFHFAVCDHDTCDLMMVDFIATYVVETVAGLAPAQSEGEQL